VTPREAFGESELVSTPIDKNLNGLPRERSQRHAKAGTVGRGCIWIADPAEVFVAAPVAGAFPRGFFGWALERLRVPAREVLHVCSGNLGPGAGGVRVDLRSEALPDVVADGRRLPFRAGAFGAALIDPPWSIEYAAQLYGTDYPRPSHLLAEAARVVRPGGRIAFLHFLVPRPPKGTKLLRVYGISAGCGYRIRALTIFQREQRSLFDNRLEQAALERGSAP